MSSKKRGGIVSRHGRRLRLVWLVMGVGFVPAASSPLLAQNDGSSQSAESPLAFARLPHVQSEPFAFLPVAHVAGLSFRDQIVSRTIHRIDAFLRSDAFLPPTTTPWVTNRRAIRRVRPSRDAGTWKVWVHLERQTSDGRFKSGETYTQLPSAINLTRQPWRLTGQILVPRALIGQGAEEYLTPMRARLVMRDAQGRRCFGPNAGCSLVPDRWMPLPALLPTWEAPIAKGLMEEGFDPSAVTEVGFNIEAGNVSHGLEVTRPQRSQYAGMVYLKDVRIEPVAAAASAEPDPVPLYPSVTHERAAAGGIEQRLRRRLELEPGEMAIVVNLAWPFRNGRYHTYGTSLGIAPWGDHWGFSSPLTANAITEDLRYLKAHGIRVVRIFLFGDFRAGLTYDARGRPNGFARLVREDMQALLDLCRREQILLIPSLVDFLVADGVTREGPGLRWEVGEHPDLLTDPEKRGALVRLLAQFVREFDGPDILMWELMNEPDNAVAVATPEHYNGLRWFIRDLAVSLHRQGILTTVGSRHLGDYQRFWRGYVDVPQLHHWRLLESIPNPYPVDTPARELGPLPAIVGEVEPVAPADVGPLLDRLRDAGYVMAGFWSLRGHDGYAYRPIAKSVQQWVERQRARRAHP